MRNYLILLGVMLSCVFNIHAQSADPSKQTIPNDPEMRIGKLENGMTYYIRSNAKPKNAADFYIVTNVGAVQESDAQNGLAHFLEHMAFNGTKNFPGKDMLNYLQKNGLAFGRNINAATGQSMTRYFISAVPTNKGEALIDSVLLVLHDWSHYISLDHKEIDNERGVIMEELRTGKTPLSDMMEERRNIIANGTIYSKRNIIGTLEGLKNFKYSDIESFYKDWYHPALQALVLVGDFDADKMEAKVKALFSKIPANKDPKVKEVVIVPDFDTMIVKRYSHEQVTSPDFWMVSHGENVNPSDNNLYSTEIKSYMTSIITTVINERLNEIRKNPAAPFLSASVGHFNIYPTKKVTFVGMSPKLDQIAEAIELITTEINRMKKYGVGAGELERAAQNLIKSNETAYNNRNDRTTSQLSSDAIANFLDKLPIISPEIDYKIAMGILKTITPEMINQYVPIVFNNKAPFLSVTIPEKSKDNIDEAGIVAAYEKGMNKAVEPIVEQIIDKNILDPKSIAQGMSVTQTEDKFNSRMWILSNGAVVIFKKTDYKNDEILFSASRKGGYSLVDDANIMEARLMGNYMYSAGVGKYSKEDLAKALSGKQARVSYYITNYFNGFRGGSSASDIETLFKLIHLSYAQPRFDENDITRFKSGMSNELKNYNSSPDNVFNVKVMEAASFNKSRELTPDLILANLDKLTVESAKTSYNKIYNGVKGMKFIFVGNAEFDEVKKLAEKYIATLHYGVDEKWINRNLPIKAGVNEDIVFPQKDNKASVAVILNGYGISVNDRTVFEMGILADILRLRYTKIVREEMGATYGVSNNASVNYSPKPTFTVNAGYDTNDKFVASTSKVIVDQIVDIAKNGPTKEELGIVITNRVKNYHNSQIVNGYWMNVLLDFYTKGYDSQSDFIPMVEKFNVDDVKKIADKVMKNSKEFKVFMTSEKLSK